MELNPNHPVTQAAHDNWHTICALIMRKLGRDEVVIVAEDVMKIQPGSLAVLAHEKKDGLHIRLVSMEEGEKLAREAGGLTV